MLRDDHGRRTRAARAEDIDAIRRVAVAAGEMFREIDEPRIAACADHEPMSAEELHELVDAERVWVAVESRVVVGFLHVRTVDGSAHVEEVSVDPAHGHRGHATALLEQAAAWAREQRLPSVTLTTFRDVPWNRPFYERRGFRVLDERELTATQRDLLAEEDERYGLPRELRVVMQRTISDA